MTETNISTARVPQVTVIDPRIPEKAKLRVAAYARVSSDSEDQVNSYIAQVDFYSKHIAGKEDWEMVDIYADEGIQLPKAAPVSTDALRIENELALCFNRADINPEYMKTLIMAAAAERYAGLNDPTPTHKLELLRQKLELEPESEETLWEVFESAVAQVRIGKGGEISLHQKDQKECAL